MRKKVFDLIEEAKSKWSGYTALYCYQLLNICVKAEPVALLSFKVEFDDEMHPLEHLANAFIPREDQFEIVPNDEEYIFPICKAIKEVHPEFDVDIKEVEETDDNTQELPKDAPEEVRNNPIEYDEECSKHIICTMPQVNKDRHDAMMDAVKALSEKYKQQMDMSKEEYKIRLDTALIGETDKRIDQSKKEYKKWTSTYDEMAKKTRERKEKEIADAYQRYQEGKQAKDAHEQEERAAKGEAVSLRMKMGETEEY